MDDHQILNSLTRLQQMYDCEMVQINGQRLFGPPREWRHSPPGRGCEIYVANIPRDTFEDELFPLFSKAGLIYQMRLMLNFSGYNRGYCFVRYCDESAVQRAIQLFDGYYIRPRQKMVVSVSTDNCRLIIRRIPRNVTEEDLKILLYGAWEGVKDVKLYMNHSDKSRNRGFAFVDFQDNRTASKAKHTKLVLQDAPLKINWARPENQMSDSVLNQIKVLYIRNLPPNTTEKELWDIFLQWFPDLLIEHLKVVKDFAFVHFGLRQQAEMVLQYWNKKSIKGSVIEVKWARPPPKKIPLESLSAPVAINRIQELEQELDRLVVDEKLHQVPKCVGEGSFKPNCLTGIPSETAHGGNAGSSFFS